ncbi:DTW domain-containing protein [Phlyctochytrium arcticum]|nr:DTW domain-containing protein [Phlyctochytrium arcticum]
MSTSQNPFAKFSIDQLPKSDLHNERQRCPQCSRSAKLFCPHCGIALGHEAPQVKLPLKVDIYRDPRETEGKSTSTHAKLVSSEDVTIKVQDLVRKIESSDLSEYENPERCLLLFPSKDALPLSAVDISAFDRVIVLDGTWRQGKAMAKAIGGMKFQHVKIQSRSTLFWRYQPFGPQFLSTIEAVYWFFREYHEAFTTVPYDGRYDNLLFYFREQWEHIQQVYQGRPDRTFTSRKLDSQDYIRKPAAQSGKIVEGPLDTSEGAI